MVLISAQKLVQYSNGALYLCVAGVCMVQGFEWARRAVNCSRLCKTGGLGGELTAGLWI